MAGLAGHRMQNFFLLPSAFFLVPSSPVKVSQGQSRPVKRCPPQSAALYPSSFCLLPCPENPRSTARYRLAPSRRSDRHPNSQRPALPDIPVTFSCQRGGLRLMFNQARTVKSKHDVVMYFGADYHPEHWVHPYAGTAEDPEARWKTDIELMVAAGMNTVRMGEFVWGLCEPRRGRIRFLLAQARHGFNGRRGHQSRPGHPDRRPADLADPKASGGSAAWTSADCPCAKAPGTPAVSTAISTGVIPRKSSAPWPKRWASIPN